MAAYHLNVWLDPELHAALEAYSATYDVTLSTAVRKLLREALSVTDGTDSAVWREALASVTARVRRRMNQAIRDVANELAAGE